MKPNEEDDEDLDIFEEDEKSKKIIMIMSGVFVVVVSAILCFFLWKLFHASPADGDTGGRESGQPYQESMAVLPEESQPQGGESREAGAGNAGGTGGRETASGESSGTGNGGGTGSQETAAGESGGAGNAGGTGSQESASGESGGAGNGGGTGGENSAAGGGGSAGTTGSHAGSESSGAALDMQFQEAADTVTAKKETNLRSEPSTARDDTVVAKLKNGETASRTGINQDTGWSRVEYNGQVLYAVSRYLTTDLTPQPAESSASAGASTGNRNSVQTKDGRTVQFTDCDDTVSPKMEVNLRGEPSTSEGNATIHVRLPYGENVHRTGYSGTGSTEEDGWSRVEYNGEVLYAKTSFLFVVDETQQAE